jgi:hypothetical protein
MSIYGSPSYSMGDDEALVQAAANAPITKSQALEAKHELKRMRRALAKWLKYRAINDAIASGNASRVPTPLFKTPGSKAPSAAVMALRLRSQRAGRDQELALRLHQLLSEVFDSATLPNPDVGKNPNAAADLAKLALGGKLPGETSSPHAQGIIWLWPLVIVVGAIAFVITSSIRSSAERAAEHEKYECIKAGKCTDTGFWMKLGGIALVSWIIWDKAGLGDRLMKRKGK